MLQKLSITPNVPQQIALKYTEGKIVEGRFGNQVYYSLSQPADSCMYLDLGPAEKVNSLEPRKGEPFWICKRWTGKKTDSPVWDVWPVGDQEAQPAGVSPQSQLEADLARSIEHVQARKAATIQFASQIAPPLNGHAATPPAKPQTKLADALKTAVDAAHQATEYAKSIGYTTMPEFMGDDLRAMACTLIIQNGGR